MTRREKFPEWRAYDERRGAELFRSWLFFSAMFALSLPATLFGLYYLIFHFGEDLVDTIAIVVLGTFLLIVTGAAAFGIWEIE